MTLMMPRVIHQIWHPFSAQSMPFDWVRFSATWKHHHPGFEHKLWGLEESRAFVARHYAQFLPIYDAYKRPIQRVDSLRILLLHHFGGLYVDLDVECLRNVQPLLAGCRVVFPAEPAIHAHLWRHKGYKQVMATAFMASEPGHPFWAAMIDELRRSAHIDDVMESTGPFALTRCYERWDDKTGLSVKPAEVIYPVSEPECRDQSAYDIEHWARATAPAFAVHHWASTWNRPGQMGKPARRPYQQGLPLKLKHPAFARTRPGQLFNQGPVVSCVMVTRGWSYPARWAVQCFLNQSYANRELVVVTTNPDGDIQSYLAGIGDPRIRFMGVLPADTSLGEQRNAAVDHAAGQYICTWDDDDLFGADRIAAGMTAILTSGASAAFLERICIWWPGRGRLAVSGRHHWENTMIARRDALPRYLSVNKSEDSQAVAVMVAKHPIVVVDDPNLFFYIVSGNNSWGADHFQRFFQRATFHAEGQAYERSLSVMNKHFPVLEYLQWLRSRDPKTFGVPLAQPVPDTRPAATPPLVGTSRLRGHAPAQTPASRALTVVMAWELGGGLGHMVPLSQVARPLLAAGHTVHMVLADLSNARAALGALAGHERLHLWQAPTWISPLFGSSEPASYAELLFRAGYLDARRLSGLVEGWGTLLDQLRPDLLLVDHSPTALLAARGRTLRTAQFGTGFFIPVMESPIPSYREWEPVPRHRVERSESLVLQTCNTILAERGQPQLDQLRDLFRCDETFLVTVPELDHFEHRARDPDQHYYGSLASASHGKPAHWPAGPGPAVFVYLKSEYRGLGEVLKRLKAGPWRVLAYIPGLTQTTVAETSGPNLRVVVDPVDMDEVCRSCDAVLCQSGSGTVATALQAGKAVVMLPMHMEQLLFARRVQALGAGLYLTEDRIDRLENCLQRVLTQQSFTEAASAFARRYAWPDGNRVAETIAMRCVELMRVADPASPALPTPQEQHTPALPAMTMPH